MRVVVISDTHGNVGGLRKVASGLATSGAVDRFVHLGDDYGDAEVFDELGSSYLRVPGVFSDHYVDGAVPNRLLQELGGWRFLLTHTRQSHANDLREDLKPEELIAQKKVDVVLYGHTHIPEISQQQGILFVNPGHLKDSDKKGYGASYAILDLGEDEIVASLVEAETGRPIKEVRHKRP